MIINPTLVFVIGYLTTMIITISALAYLIIKGYKPLESILWLIAISMVGMITTGYIQSAAEEKIKSIPYSSIVQNKYEEQTQTGKMYYVTIRYSNKCIANIPVPSHKYELTQIGATYNSYIDLYENYLKFTSKECK
jgi:hypothetical protein|nr:MAG TPA: Protein of unknown function (DUF2500) [Caudoviricetes sp.]